MERREKLRCTFPAVALTLFFSLPKGLTFAFDALVVTANWISSWPHQPITLARIAPWVELTRANRCRARGPFSLAPFPKWWATSVRDTRAKRVSSCGKKSSKHYQSVGIGVEVKKRPLHVTSQERARKKSSQSRKRRTIINSKRKKHTKLLCCSRWCYQQVVKLISSSGG